MSELVNGLNQWYLIYKNKNKDENKYSICMLTWSKYIRKYAWVILEMSNSCQLTDQVEWLMKSFIPTKKKKKRWPTGRPAFCMIPNILFSLGKIQRSAPNYPKKMVTISDILSFFLVSKNPKDKECTKNRLLEMMHIYIYIYKRIYLDWTDNISGTDC